MYNLVVVYVHPHVIEFCVICLTRPLSEMAFWVSTKLPRPIMNFLGIHEVARLGKAMQNYMIKTLGVWVLDTRCHFSISQINPGQNLPPFCWKSPKTVWVQTQWKLQYDTFPFSIEIHLICCPTWLSELTHCMGQTAAMHSFWVLLLGVPTYRRRSVTVHADTQLRRAWTRQVQRNIAIERAKSAVCFEHFTEDCFEPLI